MFGRKNQNKAQEISLAKRLTLFLSLLVVLTSTLFSTQKVSALPSLSLPGDGIFGENGKQIFYNGLIFSGPHTVKEGDSLTKQSDGHNYRAGDVFYVYSRPTDGDKTEAFIVVVNNKDNPTKGQYSRYTLSVKDRIFSDRKDTKDINLSKGEIPNIRECTIPWIGWMICPIANALATALDDLYETITDILKLSPIDTEQRYQSGEDKPIFALWTLVRNISNIVFIILFILVISSYITGFGLSNYTVKKIFPRLVVTAILVNISLSICTLLIDIFNILGYSIADIFQQIQRNTMPENDLMSINAVNWAALLSTAYGAGSLAIAMNGGIIGSTLLILGAMAGAMATIISVVVALSARQAVIVILTILAPLAFVLNLLPNTEKWFKKWWHSFVKILAIFPIFALIYGASQLASSIIIRTADNNFILILVGMIVKVIPFGLLLTVIKSSDEIMDRITNSTANRTKSLGEGLEEYLHRKQELQKIRYETGQSNGLRRLTPQGIAQSMYQNKRRDEARLRTAKARQDSAYANRASQLNKDSRPANADARVEFEARAAEAKASAMKSKMDSSYNIMVANVENNMLKKDSSGKVVGINNLNSFTNQVEYEIASASLTKQIAEGSSKAMETVQKEAQNQRIVSNVSVPLNLEFNTGSATDDIRSVISGINEKNKDFMLADIISGRRKERQTEIDYQYSFAQQINLPEADALSFAIGEDVMGSQINKELKNSGGKKTVVGKDGQSYTLDINNEVLRYAMGKLVGQAPRDDIHEFLQIATADVLDANGNIISHGSLSNFREEVTELFLGKVGSTKYMGVKTPDYTRRGLARGRDTHFEVITENIAKGRYSAEHLATVSKDGLNTMLNSVKVFLGNDSEDFLEVDPNDPTKTKSKDSIWLAKPDKDGKIVKQKLMDNYLESFKDKETNTINYQQAAEQLWSFHDMYRKALTDPRIKNKIQKQQKDLMEKTMVEIEKIIDSETFKSYSGEVKDGSKPNKKNGNVSGSERVSEKNRRQQQLHRKHTHRKSKL